MEQYISKFAVVTEIERIKKEECPTDTYEGRCKLLWFEQFLSFINTLEAKEVHYKPLDEDFERDAVSFCFDRGLNTTPYIAKTIAKHFYALGLNVSNPTSQNVQDLIEKYVSNHADCRWLDASELEKLLNDFVVEYDVIKNREYEQQCKCKSK